MKKILCSLVALAALAFSTSGCGRTDAPKPVLLSELPARLDTQFKTATPEVRALVAGLKQALRGRAMPEAFARLHQLSERTDLTATQRRVTAESVLTISQQLSEAASKGDEEAGAMVQTYHAQK